MSIKDMVANGKQVHFLRYQAVGEHQEKKELWYKTECGFEFPVPLEDTGNAAFLAQDKAMFFMRWISKHVKAIEVAKAAEGVVDQC